MDEQKNTVGAAPVQQGTAGSQPAIDIEKLAEKVYQLMRAEARLSRVRSDKRGARR